MGTPIAKPYQGPADGRFSSRSLEVVPGPGYLAIEIAKSGTYSATGLDISHSFVRIARENARKARPARMSIATTLPRAIVNRTAEKPATTAPHQETRDAVDERG